MADAAPVTRHYASDGIAERLIAALRAASGPDVPINPDTLAPLDHFHGRGVVATKELVAILDPRPGEEILDIGCGIGGPARWIAAHFGCRVTGIDLTEAFCRAAQALGEATGLSDRVAIRHGSATDLPFPDAAFDRAYSQNVVMNIADKAAFYREAFRVLRPGGVLALSNIVAGPGGPPIFPVPWAASPETSFLATVDETRGQIAAAGFEILSFRETWGEVVEQQRAFRRRLETEGFPALGVHVLIGDRMREYQRNSIRSMEERRAEPIEVLARRPA
ncbi:MAG: class I SAM-dependent methyltransferase [Alphaproteobacteria bacterium]|nr:class I SAM-dependent methyltransferase [Alphaproteobacteria bacterium]